jgi:O-antigen/teichoic acid export membrane protein
MNQNEYDVWFNLMFLASVLILCFGVAGLFFIFFNIPRLSFSSLPLLLEIILYLMSIVIGLLLIVGMYRRRKWVLNLVYILLAGWITFQIVAFLIYNTDVIDIIVNISISILISTFIIWILTRPSMKEYFST